MVAGRQNSECAARLSATSCYVRGRAAFGWNFDGRHYMLMFASGRERQHGYIPANTDAFSG